jgi:hypothetical protein
MKFPRKPLISTVALVTFGSGLRNIISVIGKGLAAGAGLAALARSGLTLSAIRNDIAQLGRRHAPEKG